MYLIFANVNPDDILIQKELDELVKKYPFRFNVKYVLNNPPPNWTGGVGFISPDMIKEFLPPPGDDTLIVRCGPGPMNKV
jgi:cytochrome-b5 reductase